MGAKTDLLLAVSQSNGGYTIGALVVARKILECKDDGLGETALRRAIMAGITGPELWLLHKDICGEDAEFTRRFLLDYSAVPRLSHLRASKFYEERPRD